MPRYHHRFFKQWLFAFRHILRTCTVMSNEVQPLLPKCDRFGSCELGGAAEVDDAMVLVAVHCFFVCMCWQDMMAEVRGEGTKLELNSHQARQRRSYNECTQICTNTLATTNACTKICTNILATIGANKHYRCQSKCSIKCMVLCMWTFYILHTVFACSPSVVRDAGLPADWPGLADSKTMQLQCFSFGALPIKHPFTDRMTCLL